MTILLTPHEARVIGALLEKEVTTPEQYPLSMNALVNACNQKSNRDPVLELDERTVQAVVDGLMKRHLVSDRASYGGRVPKYKQSFCNTNFGPLQFSELERAIVCELLLRGPQSAGELRTRCQRMATVGEVSAVEAALDALALHEAGPFVVKLGRRPGQRDARYAHLLCGPVAAADAGADEPGAEEGTDAAAGAAPGPAGGTRAALAERVAALEAEVAALRREIAELRGQMPLGGADGPG